MNIDVIKSLEWMSAHAVGTTVPSHLALRFISPSPLPGGNGHKESRSPREAKSVHFPVPGIAGHCLMVKDNHKDAGVLLAAGLCVLPLCS